MSNWETFNVVTSDGVSTPAIVSVPTGAGPFPTIVYFHASPGGVGEVGLLSATTGDSGKRWERWLAEGYVVVVADYRKNNPNHPLDIVYTGDPNAVDDARAIIEHVKELAYVDVTRIGVIGSSLGGAISVEAFRLANSGIKAAIIEYGALQKFIGMTPPFPSGCPDLTDSQINRPALEVKLATISIPVRFAQGTADMLCALNNKCYKVMFEMGLRAEISFYAGAPHGFAKGPDNQNFQRVLTDNVNFFATNVK